MKRYNGEGNIRQRKDGRWEGRVMDGYLADGRKNIYYFYGRTQKEVREKIKDFNFRKVSGIDPKVKHTFETWADLWFESHRDNITPTTQESYRYTINLLKKDLGDKKLTDIKAYDIEQYLKKLRREGRSDSYLSKCRGMLYQIFNKAEANDLILKNPVKFAEKMKAAKAPKTKEAFTADEVKILMSELPLNRIGYSIRLMLGTGMRTQEILALEPRCISEDGSVIYIIQAVNMVKGTVTVGAPKSRDSFRDIPVPPNLRYCAVFLRNTDKKYVWEAGKKGQPCNPTYFRKQFKEAIGNVKGVRVLTPHSCRHTYVSQMQALGVDIHTIQSIVGHADIDMTQHYLHVQDAIKEDAVNRFSEAFSGNLE